MNNLKSKTHVDKNSSQKTNWKSHSNLITNGTLEFHEGNYKGEI